MDAGSTDSPRQGVLIEAARRGDEDAFRRLIEPHRAELHAHCYRMLGSLHDAEDAVQEALLRAWRGLSRFEGRSSLRTWLYKIATNTCLDLIARRPKRVLPIDYGPAANHGVAVDKPLAESAWVEPYPDEELGLEDGLAAPDARYERREAVELAFIVALQHLPARQRAVLLLRDVLGFSAREVAELLDTTVASVTNALRRARKAAGERLPERSQQETLRSLGDERVGEVVQRYVAAWERGDVDAIVSMLAEDAKYAMPPFGTWYGGRDAIKVFLTESALRDEWRFVPARANGQVAFGTYSWDSDNGSYVASAVDVLNLRGATISEVTAFVTPEVFRRFGLPEELLR